MAQDEMINGKQYIDLNYYEMKTVQDSDVERCNFGLNRRVLNNNYQLYFETDLMLQALSIQPDDSATSVITYKNQNLMTSVAA